MQDISGISKELKIQVRTGSNLFRTSARKPNLEPQERFGSAWGSEPEPEPGVRFEVRTGSNRFGLEPVAAL